MTTRRSFVPVRFALEAGKITLTNERQIHLHALVIVVLAAVTTTTAVATDYPLRPLRFIVPSAPGGSPDINARLLASDLSKQLG